MIDRLLRDGVLDSADIARAAGVSPRSVHRRWLTAQDVPLPRRTEERLLELKAVLDLATRSFGPEAARLWMRTPVPALSSEQPLDVIRDGRWRLVIDLLLASAEGVTA